METLKLAKYIINKCHKENEPISNLKLQVIIYAIQKRFKEKGFSLIDEKHKMTKAGPYYESVYYQYCGYGALPIKLSYDVDLELDQDSIAIVDGAVTRMRKHAVWELADEFVDTDGEWEETLENDVVSVEDTASCSNKRKMYANTSIRPNIYPILWIRDKQSGRVHLYGTNEHDSLIINSNGSLDYYNLQNGDGTGKHGGYEFLDFGDEMGYDQVLHLNSKSNKII